MKVLLMDWAVSAAREARRDGAIIVLAHGCFDLLHIGHIQHLRAAKKLGNILIVSITSDQYVREQKGPGRPRFNADERAQALAELESVDYVVINDAPTAEPVILAIRPAVYAKGAEYRDYKTQAMTQEELAVKSVGGRIEFVTGEVVYSSTALLSGK